MVLRRITAIRDDQFGSRHIPQESRDWIYDAVNQIILCRTSGYTEIGHIPKKHGAESDIFKRPEALRGLSLNLESTAISLAARAIICVLTGFQYIWSVKCLPNHYSLARTLAKRQKQ